MAYSATGGWVGGDDWYAWLNVSKSNTSETNTRVTVSGGIYNVYAVASNFTADITSDSSGGTTNYSVGYISEYSGEKTVKTNTINVTRGTSQKTLTVMCKVYGSGIYSGSSSTAKTTVTIPAKTSYTVSYDANGGSGAPQNQTKWYGDTLKLSTTVPTRALYSFTGWNTEADGSGTAYASGANYTSNAALTLYAQWSLNYALPTITGFNVIRCTSESGYPASEEGTRGKVTFGWQFDSAASSGTYLIEYRAVGSSTYATALSGNLSSNSGTLAYTLLNPTFDVQTSYQIRLTVTDGNKTEYSQQMLSVLTQGFAHIVLGGPNHHHSVGIGKTPSDSELFDVGLDMNVDGKLTYRKVLYANETGSNGTITLSDSAANYEHLTIYYCNGASYTHSSTTIYNPNGKNVNLFLGGTTNNGGVFWPIGKDVTISGMSITTRATNRYYGAVSGTTSTAIKTAANNEIYITRVEGW